MLLSLIYAAISESSLHKTVRLSHFAKMSAPIDRIVDGKRSSFKDEQFLKALSAIVRSLDLIVTDSRDLQPSNNEVSIVDTFSGIVAFFKDEQFLNAADAIAVTESGIFWAEIDSHYFLVFIYLSFPLQI